MGFLALQSGAMPTLQKKCVDKNICRSSVVVAQEVAKLLLSALCFVCFTNPTQQHAVLEGWSVRTWGHLAAVPAKG